MDAANAPIIAFAFLRGGCVAAGPLWTARALELGPEAMERFEHFRSEHLKRLNGGTAVIEAYADLSVVLHVHCLAGDRT